MKNKNETLKWLEEKVSDKIFLPDKIKDSEKPIRGIYGIFTNEEEVEFCEYIGKSTNIYERMFIGEGHLCKIMRGEHYLSKLNEIADGECTATIIIKILEEVPYHTEDNYYKDIQLLAQKENDFISKYQKLNQCLNQLPEGTRISKLEWNNLKK